MTLAEVLQRASALPKEKQEKSFQTLLSFFFRVLKPSPQLSEQNSTYKPRSLGCGLTVQK
jgi:hypothetical protein